MAKQHEFDLTAIVGDLSFSHTDAWMWVKLPGTQYEFITTEERIGLAQDLSITVASLVTKEDKNVECHMLVSSVPFDSYNWIINLNNVDRNYNPLDYNGRYLHEMFNYVDQKGFREKLVLLGIKLGRRVEYQPAKAFGFSPLDNLINLVAAAPVSDYVSDKEIAFWNTKAEELRYSLLNSRSGASVATANEIAYVTRKQVFPAMLSPSIEDLTLGEDDPYKWGEGEIVSLLDARIENHPKWLKITQEINGNLYSGYRATLGINKFPDVYDFPSMPPWIHYAARLPFSVDFSIRFTLEPARKVRKEVGNRIKATNDQIANMTSAGGSTDMEIEEQAQLGQILDYTLKKDTTPWVYSYYRVSVEGETEEELKENVRQTIDLYRNLNMQLVWPSGDQLSLLKENLPNDHVRSKSYYQRQELPILGAGVPAGVGGVGDQIRHANGTTRGYIGPYIGRTIGQVQSPVFFSIHSAINADNPGACSITGQPGSGKTFLGLNLGTQMALSGAWTIYIDPKADALGLINVPGLEKSSVIDLRNSPDGALDPFSIGLSSSEQKDLAYETISLFVGGQDRLTDEQNVALARAITTISDYPDPSLDRVVDYLIASPEGGAKSLGARLNLIRELPFARLCFANGSNQKLLRVENGLTIITILGLDLPGSNVPKENYTNANFLAVSVMYLLASLTKQLMLSSIKSQPKAIVIDEAWAITSTQQGMKLVDEVARMGRAHNTALLLISQNTGDFMNSSVKNSISTKFAFRAGGPEVDNVLDYLELEINDNNRDWVRELPTGACLMRDWSGRVAPVQIDRWNDVLAVAFETNPMARAANEANKR